MADLLDSIEIETAPNPDAAVVWMHGLGADGHDFEPIVPELRLPATTRIRFVFPHAPLRPVTINQGHVMRAWYDVRALAGVRREDEAGVRQSAAPGRGAARAGAAARHRPRPPGDRRLLPGRRHGAARGPAPPRPARGDPRALVLPAAGQHARRRAVARPTATCRSSGPTALHDPMIPQAMAEQGRAQLAAARLPDRLAPVPDPALRLGGRDRRRRPLARAGARRVTSTLRR